MENKKVVLVGAGTIMQMVKCSLSELKGVEVIETNPATIQDLIFFVQQQHPSVIILEQSAESEVNLEVLLMITRETNIKVVEVSPHSNTIQVANWYQVQLERMQDFLAVL